MAPYGLAHVEEAGVDPGFLDRGFKFTKGVNLKIAPDYLIFYPDFSGNS